MNQHVLLDPGSVGHNGHMACTLTSHCLFLSLQLAHILLQLQHHGPCAAVCLKALTDAARAADVAWSARLLQVQAAALAAQEDYPQALNCYRAALTRYVLAAFAGLQEAVSRLTVQAWTLCAGCCRLCRRLAASCAHRIRRCLG